MFVINNGMLPLLCPLLTTCLSPPQVLELLCNKAQPHRCSTGLMGSLSPSWRRPGLSGDRPGRDGQKWGASCHDNRWRLLIGQGTREQARLFFFFHHHDENKNTCLWICTPRHKSQAHRAFWFLHMYCITSASPSFFSYCSYMPTITHSHAVTTANLIQLESSKAMLHLQDVKPIWGYEGVKWVLSHLSYVLTVFFKDWKWHYSCI